MSDKAIKDTIFKKGVKSIPNVIWVLCASYALIMLTNLFVLNFAHIDADKHINRYLDILLTNKENSQQCKVPDINLMQRINALEDRQEQLIIDNDSLKLLAHEAG